MILRSAGSSNNPTHTLNISTGLSLSSFNGESTITVTPDPNIYLINKLSTLTPLEIDNLVKFVKVISSDNPNISNALKDLLIHCKLND
jgi:hypothetical protein